MSAITEASARVPFHKSGPVELQQHHQVPVYKARGTIATASVLTLNATPVALVPAPGSGKIIVPKSLHLWYDYNSAAYAAIAAGEDLIVSYTNGSGEEVARVETTGFLDQTADEHRFVNCKAGVDAVADFEPVANAALVLSLLSGEITTGNSPIKFEVIYEIRDLTW